MAFSFASAAGTGAASGAQAHIAQDLEEITTEALGFLAIAGERKLRLLPTPWPADALPPSTASLISVASGKGLVAAAGPDALVIASTDAVRHAFTEEGAVENNIKAFTPQLTIPVPRLSQVAFTSDESFLVICAEQGGGLAVHDVQALMQGNKDPAFQIGTNSTAVRALAVNPAQESAHLVSIVLSNGQLLLANLKERSLVSGPNGPALKENVSCVSWSNKGKQLVAGLGDGTAFQMTPDGAGKAQIPRLPSVPADHYVSSIYWLANDDFFIVYTPTAPPEPDRAPDSVFYIVHREKNTSNYSFHKLGDPSPPFGMNRSPPHHFVVRLRDFAPNLDDVLIVSSTASGDVGLLTRSSAPLTSDMAAERITNTWTTTSMAEDSRRAQLPVTEEMTDTSPVGMALDLSSKDKVPRPFPSDEIDESSTPLPALMLLNHEGVLCTWWIVYNESIKQKIPYHGLTAAGGTQATPTKPQETSPLANATPQSPQPSAFGGTFAKPAVPAFGTPAFGTPGLGSSSTGAFGGPSALGANKSPWASQSTSSPAMQTGGATFGKPAFGSSTPFGQPAFGSSTPLGATSGTAAFGAPGGMGTRASPWGAAGAGTQQSSAEPAKPVNPFGGASTAAASPFASLGGGSAATSSRFASFGVNKAGVSSSPFASLGQQNKPGQPIFASATPSTTTSGVSFGMTPEPSFGSTITIDSSTGGGSTLGSSKSPWGTSSFNNTPAQPATSTFGKPSFTAPPTQEASMDDAGEQPTSKEVQLAEKKDTPFGLGTNGFRIGSSFKDKATTDGGEGPDADQDKDAGKSLFGAGFGNALAEAKPAEPATPIKKEPGTDEGPKLDDISTTPASPPKTLAAPSHGGLVDVGKPSPFLPATKPAETPKAKEKSPAPEESPSESQETPLPESPKSPKPTQASEDEDEVPPLAGSPPINVEAPASSSPESEEEGEVEDDAPLPPDPSTVKNPSWFDEVPPGAQAAPTQPKPTWTFPPPSKPTEQPRPRSPPRPAAKSPLAISHTPAGFPKAPYFPIPSSQTQQSPRSPSPVRSSSTPVSRPLAVPSAKPVSRPSSRLAESQPAPPTPEPETTDLSDNEDERIRAELAAPVVGTLKLEPFIAHQDYAGQVTKEGIPGQIERVYRDINSMIDTLGLNARALSAFIKGHTEFMPEGGRDRQSLEKAAADDDDDDDWCLVEIEDLSNLESNLEQSLEGRITDAPSKLTTLRALQRDAARLRARTATLRAHIDAHADPATRAAVRAAPLPPDQAVQQADLRAGFAAFQRLLARAEEELTMLRARLASVPTPSSSSRPGAAKPVQPTVEAVTNTIRKMTGMVERKNSELDVLEAQMRRLRLGTPALAEGGSVAGAESSVDGDGADDAAAAAGSREASPFVTPASSARGRTYGLFFTPEGGSGSPVAKGVNGAGAGGKIMGSVSEEDVRRFNGRAARRKAVLGRLREGVLSRGTRQTGLSG